MNKGILGFAILIILVSIVSATQPQLPFQSSDNTLLIDYPKYDVLKVNQDHRFHAHVINQTKAKTNLTTSCIIHLYNTTGWDIVYAPMEWESYNGLDFAYTISGKNWSKAGMYSYIIQCNSSNEIGFVSGQLQVTQSGSTYTTEGSITYLSATIIFIVIAFFLLIIGIYNENIAIKIIFIGLGGVILFACVLFNAVILSQTTSEFPDIIEGFSAFLTVLKILVGILIVALIIVVLIFAYNTWAIKRGFKG